MGGAARSSYLDSQENQDDGGRVGEGDDRLLAEVVGGIQGWRCCGNDQGNRSQEEQGAAGLVDGHREGLGLVSRAADQEAAACKQMRGVSGQVQQPAGQCEI